MLKEKELFLYLRSSLPSIRRSRPGVYLALSTRSTLHAFLSRLRSSTSEMWDLVSSILTSTPPPTCSATEKESLLHKSKHLTGCLCSSLRERGVRVWERAILVCRLATTLFCFFRLSNHPNACFLVGATGGALRGASQRSLRKRVDHVISLLLLSCNGDTDASAQQVRTVCRGVEIVGLQDNLLTRRQLKDDTIQLHRLRFKTNWTNT